MKITQVSTPWCGPCRISKGLLEPYMEKGLDFEYVDISTPEGKERMDELGPYKNSIPMFFDGEGQPLRLGHNEVLKLVQDEYDED